MNTRRFTKIILTALVTFLLIVSSVAIATAEEDVIVLINYKVETGYFEGEPALFIPYIWKGEKHSFVWDTLEIEAWRPIWIKPTSTGACYDAGYCTIQEEQP